MILNINEAMGDIGQQLTLIASLKLRNGAIDEETYLFEQRLRKSYKLLLDLEDDLVRRVRKEYRNGPKKQPPE